MQQREAKLQPAWSMQRCILIQEKVQFVAFLGNFATAKVVRTAMTCHNLVTINHTISTAPLVLPCTMIISNFQNTK